MQNTHDVWEKVDRCAVNGTGKIFAVKELRLKFYEVTGQTAPLRNTVDYINEAVRYRWNECDEWYVDSLMMFMFYSREKIQSYWDHYYNKGDGAAPTMYMGKLVGWRGFSYYQQKLGPVSFRQFDFDPFGLNVDDKPEPAMHNEYGFWAFKKKSEIIQYLAYHMMNKDMCHIYCPVSLSGTVIEHEKGYRAQNLEILGMYAKVNNSRRRGIANKLGWPGKIHNLADGPELFEDTLTEIPNAES